MQPGGIRDVISMRADSEGQLCSVTVPRVVEFLGSVAEDVLDRTAIRAMRPGLGGIKDVGW